MLENPSNAGRFLYVMSCPDSTYEDIQALKETEDAIGLRAFARAIGPTQWKDLQRQLQYDRDFPISRDWHVGYYRGVFRGVPCYFMRHSGIEHIYTLNGKLGPSLEARKNPKEPYSALVIVHTSSIDSFAWHEGRQEAAALLDEWLAAVREAQREGTLVVLVDQGWDGALAHRFFSAVQEPVEVVLFDEDEQPWDEFLLALKALLKKHGVKNVRVGGIWYDPENASGCVNETVRYLKRQRFAVKVDLDLCGSHSD